MPTPHVGRIEVLSHWECLPARDPEVREWKSLQARLRALRKTLDTLGDLDPEDVELYQEETLRQREQAHARAKELIRQIDARVLDALLDEDAADSSAPKRGHRYEVLSDGSGKYLVREDQWPNVLEGVTAAAALLAMTSTLLFSAMAFVGLSSLFVPLDDGDELTGGMFCAVGIPALVFWAVYGLRLLPAYRSYEPVKVGKVPSGWKSEDGKPTPALIAYLEHAALLERTRKRLEVMKTLSVETAEYRQVLKSRLSQLEEEERELLRALGRESADRAFAAV